MKITDFSKNKFKIQGTGIDTVSTKERVFKSKTTGEVVFTIPAGTRVHVDFSPNEYPNRIFVTVGDEVKVSRTTSASNWLKGFTKSPSQKTLERWSSEGVAKSVTGHKVEPDGYGPDGSPSWMLVVGII